MATVQQNEEEAQGKLPVIYFNVTEDFKLRVDMEVTRQRTTLRDFGTRALEKYMDSLEDLRSSEPPLFVPKAAAVETT